MLLLLMVALWASSTQNPTDSGEDLDEEEKPNVQRVFYSSPGEVDFGDQELNEFWIVDRVRIREGFIE